MGSNGITSFLPRTALSNLAGTLRLPILLVVLALAVGAASQGEMQSSSSTNFETLSAKAAEARDADRLDEAITLYRRALVLRPRWTEGWWSLGTLQYDQSHYAPAAKDFEKVIALDAANGTAHAMLGLCEFELGEDVPALKNLLEGRRLGLLKNPDLNNVVLYHLSLLELRARKYHNAMDTLTQLVQEGVKTKEVITALGMTALLVQPDEAPPEGTPGAAVVERVGEAEALLEAKDFERAKDAYTELATEYPEYPNLHFAFGRFLLELHETDNAVVQFQQEIQNTPGHVEARLEIAAVRYRLDSADGVKYAEQAVKLDPKRPFGHYLLGLLYLDTQDFSGAISELETAKRSFPNVPEVYFALGNAYARAGRKAEAVRARAVFTRLNAQNNRQPADTVYGEQPSGLTEEKLESQPSSKPHE
jgi:tetratricopeptide (TPR) repeat protein